MLRKSSKRVSFGPRYSDKPTISLKYSFDVTPRNQKRSARSFTSRLNAIAPMKFLRRVGTNMMQALRLFSRRKAAAASPLYAIPRRYSASGDHYTTEAIDDCIEFINSYRKSF